MKTNQPKNPEGKVHIAEFSKVPPVLTHDLTITDGAVRLYSHMYWQFYINSKTNTEGQKSMAASMGVSEVTIVKRIEELEYHDWIVVVEQERDKVSGNYRTPFYHVFVDQKDALEFRKNYKCGPGESLRPKPTEAREKKSRKGKGGKLSNLKQYNESDQSNSSSHSHTNSSWDGQSNSGSDGGTNPSRSRDTNSSWSELDSILDTTQDSNTPPLPPKGQGLDESTPPSTKPDVLKQAEAVVEAIDPPSPPPISDEQAAKMLINSFLTATKSAAKYMLDSHHRKGEALILYESGIRPYHIGVYVNRNRDEEGLWKGRNVSWKFLVDNIVSHFELRPVVTVVYEPETPLEPLIPAGKQDGPIISSEDLITMFDAVTKGMEMPL